jgi:hypothetical protein
MMPLSATSSNITQQALAHQAISEELEKVRQERDFYHSKLMRVKEKITEGRKSRETTPTVVTRKRKASSGRKSSAKYSQGSRRSGQIADLQIKTSQEYRAASRERSRSGSRP